MWKLADSNKIIGTHMKVQSYKNHMRSLKNAKSQLDLSTPWKPSFSLSKRKNKYHKFIQSKVEKQNAALLQRMLQIQGQPMTNTCMNIPLTIPSNKITYAGLKNRQRRHTNHEINKQNRKILSKIEGATSDYGKQVWREDWKKNMKYKSNITKKQYVPDYRILAKEEQALIQSRQRPQSAVPYNYA